jgi:hypothetical protein
MGPAKAGIAHAVAIRNTSGRILCIAISLLWFDDFHRDEPAGKSGLVPTPMLRLAVFS